MLPCETGDNIDEDGDGKINDGCPQVNGLPETGPMCDNGTSDEPSTDAPEDSDINDGCPQFGDVSEGAFALDPAGCHAGGDEGSCVQRQNPAARGVYSFAIYAESKRDADGDGIENGLDTCPLVPNLIWNPRTVSPGDADRDGLPDECDPFPEVMSPGSPQSCYAGNIGEDEDQDCLANRGDNCPLVSQYVPRAPFVTMPPDSDRDGIGDACDPHPGLPDGGYAHVCLVLPVVVGENGTSARASGVGAGGACDAGPRPVPAGAPTPTPAPTQPATATPTETPTPTATPLLTSTPTPTSTATPGATPTPTPTPTVPHRTNAPTPVATPTTTATPSGQTPQPTEAPTPVPTPTPTPTQPASATPTPTHTAAPTATPSATPSPVASTDPTAGSTATADPTPSPRALQAAQAPAVLPATGGQSDNAGDGAATALWLGAGLSLLAAAVLIVSRRRA